MEFSGEMIYMAGFLCFIFIMLAVDLGVFNKGNKDVTVKQAVKMSCLWVSFALLFGGLLYEYGDMLHGVTTVEQLQDVVIRYQHNMTVDASNFAISLEEYRTTLTLEYLTGYVVEYALSVDNIFVILLIFSAFGLDKKYYHKVLFWGILGAIVMRFVFIFIGATLVSEFNWILYLFGVFLVYSGGLMLFKEEKEGEINPRSNKIVKLAQSLFPVSNSMEGGRFFTIQNGKRMVTPLFIILLVVEFTDVIFAVDSIPAIFSVTKDPYIVLFSNIFAILGLRSMFFILVNVMHKFHYLKIGLSLLLIFIGGKMLAHHWLSELGFETSHSLIVVITILSVSVVASLIFPKKD